MQIECFTSGPLDTNAYVVYGGPSQEAVIIDAPYGSVEPISQFLQKKALTVKNLLLTHSHLDHIADAKALQSAFNLSIFIHSLDAYNLLKPGSDKIALFPIEGVNDYQEIRDGQVLHCADWEFAVLHTPGHSPGGVCFYIEQEKVLFSGDTLFKNAIGSLSLPTAQPEKMFVSLKRILSLPLDTRVFPGHGEKTTIQDQQWLLKAREYFT